MSRASLVMILAVLGAVADRALGAEPALEPQQWRQVEQAEQARIRAIESVQGSVVAVFGNERMGGGSGVLISPDGLALTNFHVVASAGEQGLAGLADGKLYPWKLVGFDPGGDVAVIQLSDPPTGGFPFARLGDSQSVRVGDWAMAMGNPFVLAEDFKPTVTLGIISGLHRFQEGEGGKGSKLLVYGDCIQVDSSINPGNSGGPLFDLAGRLIGINGRGSFEERGRVNVGVGYAISLRQIENFLPDLLAAKLCVHATLDATFRDQGGKVICESINRDGVLGKLGLDLTDVLLSFDGQAITSANQFNNLITTVPAQWPVQVVWEHDGKERREIIRLEKLPYDRPPIRPRPRVPETRPGATRPASATQPAATSPASQVAGPSTRPSGRAVTRPATRPARRPRRGPQLPPEPPELRPSEPGAVRDVQVNHQMAQRVLRDWQNFRQSAGGLQGASVQAFRQTEDVLRDGRKIGSRTVIWTTDGREAVESADPTVTAALSVATLSAPAAAGRGTAAGLDMAAATIAKVQYAPYRNLYESYVSDTLAPIELQGGDKAQGQRANRILVRPPSGPPALFWFSVLGSGENLEARLLKAASADADGVEGELALTFSDYRPESGIMVPHRRTIVRGLAETPIIEMVTTSCQALPEVPAAVRGADTRPAASTEPGIPAALSIATTAPDPSSRSATNPANDDLAAAALPANFLSGAIAYAQQRCVKILGASVGMEHGYATGIIVSPDGRILTAQGIYTVSPGELRVVLPNGRVFSGGDIHILRRSDPLQALLLKIDIDTPDYFDLSQAPAVQKGDWVAAVGNWFKVAEGTELLSANLGVVSLRAPMDTRHRLQDVNLEGDVLLIDAITANPGAPGGALITADGQLAGMIGKVVESKSTNTRINYALPADRLWLFLEGREPAPVVAATRSSAGEIGFSGIRIFLLGGPRAPAFINSVIPDSPAARAGLQKDDLILRVDNDYVGSCREYQTLSGKWKAAR